MIVVDASVWISFLVQQDVNYAVTQPWLAKTLTSGEAIAAPVLLLAEVGGAIARRTGRAEVGNSTIEHLLAIPTLRLVSVDHSLGIRAARIAANYRLRGADAVYVAIAAELNIALVSWDQEQLNRVTDLVTTYTPAS